MKTRLANPGKKTAGLALTGFCGLLLALGVYTTSPPGKTAPVPASEALESRQKEGLLAGLQSRILSQPLAFIPNRGQIAPEVRYLAKGTGFNLFLTEHAAWLELSSPSPTPVALTKKPFKTVRMGWKGARPVTPLGESLLPGKVNYLIGNDPKQWHTQLPTFQRIRYPELYPDIDLVIYGNNREPEYDFHLAPHADPDQIVLTYEGMDRLRLDDAGRLHVESDGLDVVQPAPVAFQEEGGQRIPVSARYVLSGPNEVGFALGSYNPDLPLIIDPVIISLQFSTYLGGSGSDVGFSIAVDASGSAYVAGSTASTNFPTTSATQGTNGGSNDAFVTKYNASGSAIVYSTYLGGLGIDEALGIAVDSSGRAFITGRTLSNNFPTQAALDSTLGGTEDAFVSKLETNGASLVFSTYLGGGADDNGNEIALDTSGNAYITGFTQSTDFPTVSAFQGTLSGGSGQDAFVTKYAASGGSIAFSTYLGGTGSDEGLGIAVDSSGNAHVTGSTASSDFPTQSALDTSLGGSEDAFVTRFASAGSSLTWSTYHGGSQADAATGLALDLTGNVYITGRTASSDFPTLQAFQSTFGDGGNDGFITKILSNGSSMVFSSFVGGTGIDQGLGIGVDQNSNILIAGRTDSTDFPVLNSAQSALSGGSGSDGFVLRLSNLGTGLDWSTYFGGTGSDQATAIAVDLLGDAYVTGFTGSTNFPTSSAVQSSSGGGGADAFVFKLDSTDIDAGIAPSTTVVMPYWQTGSNIYTFVAITHPSLEGMSPEIGVQVQAFLHTSDQFGPATEFTISAGEQQRVFIMTPDHPLVGATSDPGISFITGTADSVGRIRFSPIATNPSVPLSNGGYPDITMLSYWGAVVVDGIFTGFAVTFIGDLHDSASYPGISPGSFPSGVN